MIQNIVIYFHCKFLTITSFFFALKSYVFFIVINIMLQMLTNKLHWTSWTVFNPKYFCDLLHLPVKYFYIFLYWILLLNNQNKLIVKTYCSQSWQYNKPGKKKKKKTSAQQDFIRQTKLQKVSNLQSGAWSTVWETRQRSWFITGRLCSLCP